MLKAQKYCLLQRATWKAQKQMSAHTNTLSGESCELTQWWSDQGNHITPLVNKTHSHLEEKSDMSGVQSIFLYNLKQQLLHL